MAKLKSTQAVIDSTQVTPCPACKHTEWSGPRYYKSTTKQVRTVTTVRTVADQPASLAWTCNQCGYIRHEPCSITD